MSDTDSATPRSDALREAFDRLAPLRSRDRSWHGVFYRDRLRWLTFLIRPDASVLEVGCGTGLTLSSLPHARKTGIDFSPAMLDIARRTDPTSQYLLDDAEDLAYREPHDYVLLLDSINFISDVQRALPSIRTSVCHERTRLVITYYNFLWQPLFLLAELIGWKTRFPEQNWLQRSDIHNLLEVSGFEVVQTGERVLCPVGIPLVAPLCNRILARLPLLRALCLIKYTVARPLVMERRPRTVTVLSAVRNERGNIGRIVESMPQLGSSTELLFVEGHSTDGTWEEMVRYADMPREGLTVRALKQQGTGKADALHTGAAASTGEIIIVYDGDYTVHPKELRQLVDVLTEGRAEFVNGSRLVYPLEKGAMRLFNLIGNRIFSGLFSWLFSQKINDSLSPVKAFFRRDYAYMHSRLDPFGDFDLFLGASEQQLKMREVPVHYLPRSYGTTKIRRFRHGWLLFRMFLHGARKLKWI